MKKIVLILFPILAVIGIGTSFYFFKGRTVGCLIDLGVIEVSEYESGHRNKIELNEKQLIDLENELKIWWSTSNKGWTPSFVSYVPKFLIVVKSGSLNILKNKIVVNCNGVQLARKLEDADNAFVEKIKSAD